MKKFANPNEPQRLRCRLTIASHAPQFLMVILLCAVLAVPNLNAQSPSEEYRVKAAFLFHFAQLAEWPVGAFATNENDLTVCTIGGDPFQGQLDSALSGKVVGSRAVKVKHLKAGEDARSCRVLFVATANAKEVASLISQLGNAPVLTVGQTDSFARDGGIIGFCLEDGKVRFEINLAASQHAGIKISSRLLLLAKDVIAN
jgi:hypothetical protein